MINVKISPSVLSVDIEKIGDAVKDLAKFGADYVHCDCLDGVFAPNTSDGIRMVKICKANSTLPLDVHLMIMNPDKYIKDYVDAGADIITFHEAACTKTAETLDLIHSYGKKAGLVLNPDVEVSKIEISAIVASIRLDNIVSTLAKTSRSKAQEILKQERVFLNHQVETKASKEVKVGDIITIRGKGRFEFKEIAGNTRKGRFVIKIDKYV